jgi:hypothetical protein
VFTTLFKTATDEKRGDKMAPTAPNIESAIATPSTVRIKGTGFSTNATVAINGTVLKPTTVAETEIVVDVASLGLAVGLLINVVVKNPADAGGDSAVFSVAVA